MAAHTPVLRNTTVRSIPSAMPVKSVRNRLPEDFFRVVEACVSRRRVVSRAKEERFRRPVWLARLSDCRCRRKVWFVSSHVRRSARSLIPVTMSESSCFSARIAARPLRAGVGRTRGKTFEVFKRDRQPGPVRRQGFGRDQQGP